MVLWCGLLCAQSWLGFELCNHFLDERINMIVTVAMGMPVGIGLSSVVFFYLSAIFGQNVLHLVLHTIILFCGSAFVCNRRRYARGSTRPFKRGDLLPVSIFVAVSAYLCSKFYFPAPRSLSLAIDSHIVEELSLQSSFFVGVNSGFLNPFIVRHPNYAGKRVVSRWLMAFHSSMMRIGFASMRISLVFPSMLLLSSFFVILEELAREFHLPRFLACFVPLISISISGFGFLRILIKDRNSVRTNDYVSQSGYGKVTRFHPVIHILISFRHTILALSICSSLFYVLYWSIRHNNPRQIMLPVTGFFVGFVLPAVQHQALFGVIVFYCAFSCLQFVENRENMKEFKLCSLFFAAGFAFHMPRYVNFSFIQEVSSIETPWRMLVSRGEFVPAFSVWWHNCGLFIVIVLCFSWFKLSLVEYNLFLPALVCFATFNYWKLQFLVEYNIFVFFTVFYPVASIVLVTTIYRFATDPPEMEAKGVLTALGVIVTLICTSSSLMGVYKQGNNIRSVWGTAEEQMAQWVLHNTPKDAVFLAPLVLLNPVSVLAGRVMYLENSAVLNHLGFNATLREKEYMEFIASNGTSGNLNEVDFILTVDDKWTLPPDGWREIHTRRDFSVYQRI